MVFSSLTFLFYFLSIVLIIYYIVPKKIRNVVLFISSLLFYFYGEPKFGILMIISIFLTYVHGILIDKYPQHKKKFLISSVIISVGLLIIFKYTDFIISNINMISKGNIEMLNLRLPIGISFYTFQMISYIIDVYKGEAKVQKSFLKLATYVALFPQLIAGPIVRYTTIEKELDYREYNFKNFSNGVRRFIIGLSKKILIANVLADAINSFNASSEKTVLFYWIYAIATTLQIYFDFSGYSDMAIGLGKMLGFSFPENFNYPYISSSVTEFWRRWHITLSTWFKDYVYIPLGGNRVSKIKWLRNILIVWFLTGLWHGAAWNFILWGVLYGILLIIEKLGLLKILNKIPKAISRIYVLFVTIIGFIIFSGNNIEEIFENIGGIFGIGTTGLINKESIYCLFNYLSVIIIGIIGATPIIKNVINNIKKKNCKIINTLEPIVLGVLLIVCVSYLVDGSFNPFLYFRF
ncbi:MAG: MBOAT family O-acyltransferase [Clostridia bacterium]